MDRTEQAVRMAILAGRLPHTVKYGRKLLRVRDVEAYKSMRRGPKPGRPKTKRESEG